MSDRLKFSPRSAFYILLSGIIILVLVILSQSSEREYYYSDKVARLEKKLLQLDRVQIGDERDFYSTNSDEFIKELEKQLENKLKITGIKKNLKGRILKFTYDEIKIEGKVEYEVLNKFLKYLSKLEHPVSMDSWQISQGNDNDMGESLYASFFIRHYKPNV